jgi:hypothetical protein
MSYDRAPSITLLELWERRSAKNNLYFSGFLGGLQVALLRDGERPHPTRPDETVVVWRLVASERQPRDAVPKAAARPPERDPAPGPPVAQPPRWRRASWSLPGAAAALPPRGHAGQAGAGVGRDRARLRARGRSGRRDPVLRFRPRGRGTLTCFPTWAGWAMPSRKSLITHDRRWALILRRDRRCFWVLGWLWMLQAVVSLVVIRWLVAL